MIGKNVSFLKRKKTWPYLKARRQSIKDTETTRKKILNNGEWLGLVQREKASVNMATDCVTTQEVLSILSARSWSKMGPPTDHIMINWGLPGTPVPVTHAGQPGAVQFMFPAIVYIGHRQRGPEHRWHLGGARSFGFQKTSSWDIPPPTRCTESRP